MTHTSKTLAYVLRHNPSDLSLQLTPDGWVEVDTLLVRLAQRKNIHLTLAELEQLVADDAKGRYSLRDGMIRANQGHSVKGIQAVELIPRTPPPVLYHGTTEQRWARIRESDGLKKMNRHHVHLTDNLETAWETGRRHRKETPLVLRIDAAAMTDFEFYLSENGVWHVDRVPLTFLTPS